MMKRKRYTFVKAARAASARVLRHRAACRRYKARRRLGVRLNRPRMSRAEFDSWLREA